MSELTELEPTNLDYLPEPYRTNGNTLQAEMLRLQTDELRGDWLWKAAVDNLGNNEDEKYCGFYICENCGSLYHNDFSSSWYMEDDPHYFCDYECQLEAGFPDPEDGDYEEEE